MSTNSSVFTVFPTNPNWNYQKPKYTDVVGKYVLVEFEVRNIQKRSRLYFVKGVFQYRKIIGQKAIRWAIISLQEPILLKYKDIYPLFSESGTLLEWSTKTDKGSVFKGIYADDRHSLAIAWNAFVNRGGEYD